MSYDNTCKNLVEMNPVAFAQWLLGAEVITVEVLKTELSIEPIRADSVLFMSVDENILHLEFQTEYGSTPPLPLRMLDYYVRLYRLYRRPIIQIVLLLVKPPPKTLIEEQFVSLTTLHRYRVVKIWEQDPQTFLDEPALLPFATLIATDAPEQLLRQVANSITALPEISKRQNLWAYAKILGGLRFSDAFLDQVLGEELMEQSVIYQRILRKGEEKGLLKGLTEGLTEGLTQGRTEGRTEGRMEGRNEGRLSEARLLLIRVLTKRFGSLSPALLQKLGTIPTPERIEQLLDLALDAVTLEEFDTRIELFLI